MPAVEFSKSVERWVTKAKSNATRSVKGRIGYVFARAVSLTPVADGTHHDAPPGRAKGNWNCSLDAPNYDYDPSNLDEEGSATVQAAYEVLDLVTMDTIKVYIRNNAPYIRRLEYGWSNQAPSGMMRIAAAEFADPYGVGGRLRLPDE